MLGKLRQDYTPIPVRAFQPQTRITGDLSTAIAAPSPARVLQEKLELHTSGSLDKWSPRRSLALVIVSASTLWLAVIAAAGGVMHAIV